MGIARDQLRLLLNRKFYNPGFFDRHLPDPFHAIYEEDTKIPNVYFEDVVTFFVTSDVAKTTGLSVNDVYYHYDLPMYTKLKEIIRNDNKEKAKMTEKLNKEMQHRQDELLNSSKNSS